MDRGRADGTLFGDSATLEAHDKAIVAARLQLLRALRTVEAGGDPPGTSASYYSIRAIEKVLPCDVRWQEALKDELYPSEG